MTAVKTIDHEPRQIETARPHATTPMEMINQAVANGGGVEMIEKLMVLQERWEANQGRKAFDASMSEAKSEIGPILKNRKVDFTSQKGRTNYRYEDLAQIATQVDPILARHGLSYRYRTEQSESTVTVHCIVSHRDGYSETTTLSGPVDMTGNKNSLQSIGSTATFLQRYTLKAALGLAVSNDDDGNTACPGETIGANQFRALQSMIDETGTDIEAFCRHFKIQAVADMPASKFTMAEQLLKQKRSKANG